MADDDLICNFRKCRKRLTTFAWVTSCSHIFCDEDGSREFNKAFKCPACNTNLSGKFDIIRHDLQPSEEYKSMLLSGLRPETIMEVCTRAIAFWSYQAHNEKVYHEYVSTSAKESKDQLEKYYEQLLGQIQHELTNVKSQLAAKAKDVTDTKKRLSEITEKHADRNRQLQRLQAMYDSLRRKTINPAMLSDEQYHAMKSAFTLPFNTTGNKTLPNEAEMPQRVISNTSPHKDFHFTPVPMSEASDNQGFELPRARSFNDGHIFEPPKARTHRFAIELNTPRGGVK